MPFWIKQFLSNPRAHIDALEEIIVVTVVSLIPLLLLAVVDQLRAEHGNIYVVFWAAISSGQLYLYSFAILGMINWLCWKDHGHLQRFPPRKYLALVAFVFSVIIIAVYTSDPALSKTLSPPLITTSIVVYVIYNGLYYILRVYDNLSPPSVPKQLKSESDAMAVRYEEDKAPRQN